jgi:hypothetical protein
MGRGFVAGFARPGGTAVSKLFGSKAGILWIRARRSTSAHAFMNNAFAGKVATRLAPARRYLYAMCRVAFGARSNGQEATAKKQRQ